MLLATIGFSAISLSWTPDISAGIQTLGGFIMAVSSGISLLLLIGDRSEHLRPFAHGLLVSWCLHGTIALYEILTERHLISPYGGILAVYQTTRIEDVIGSVAWTTFGNPNELGVFFLLAISLLATRKTVGLDTRRRYAFVIFLLVAVSVYIGQSSLDDARAFRVGIIAITIVRFVPLSIAHRQAVGVFFLSGWIVVLAALLDSPLSSAASNLFQNVRLDPRYPLAARGILSSLQRAGLGLGIGSESWLIESGVIPTNFHNIYVRVLVELGLVPALLLATFTVAPILRWLLTSTTEARKNRRVQASRAMMAIAVITGGVTSSSVLANPIWFSFLVLLVVPLGVATVNSEPKVV